MTDGTLAPRFQRDYFILEALEPALIGGLKATFRRSRHLARVRKRVIALPSCALSSGSASETFAVATTLSGAWPLVCAISQQASA